MNDNRENGDNYTDGYISIGEFAKPHGIHGELLFIPYNPLTDAIGLNVSLFIKKTDCYSFIDIEKIRPVNKGYLIKICDVNSIEEAEKFKRVPIFIKKTDIIVDKDEYLISDLIGLDCYNEIGKNIGIVSEIYSGETDVVGITSDKDIYLIPMTENNIKSIDIKSLEINVKNEEDYKI
ncbi:ribosome maturation factor RimM [Candidatus Acidulodesulfobacterium sp. H_13]|uniref:ribosome maturation factor RimM n=1 Tax=Candidatus Acidulodesulfobacterium sp. H_13 TaxID=3395470 RepID=UPI003AF586F2